MANINRTILEQLLPFKRRVISLMVIFFIASGISAVIPAIYGRLVDMAIGGSSLKIMAAILLFWLVLSLVGNWLERYGNRHSQALSIKLEMSFVTKLTDHFLHLPYSYLKEQKSGKMIKGIDRGADSLEHVVREILFFFLPDFLAIVLIIIFMATIHWVLSLALLVIAVFYILVTIIKSKPIVKAGRKLNLAYRNAYGNYFENINDYQTVRAFSAEDAFLKSLNKDYKRIIDRVWEVALFWSKLSSWVATIHHVSFVGLFGVGMVMMSRGIITPGNLVSYVGYSAFAFNILGKLGRYYSMYQRDSVNILEAYKLMDVKREVDIRKGKIKEIDSVAGKITFKNVSFNYAEKKQQAALKNINFTIEAGEVVALVGKSGSGKTTLVDLISGYYLPTRGNVFIDHYNTKEIDGKKLRQYISLVPQEVTLFHESIAFNIKYGQRSAKLADIKKIGQLTNIDGFVSNLPKGYESKVGERGVKLSVGQKQRIAIARALIRSPKILILDEATSSLDSVTEKKVQEALDILIKGRTTFVIAHRLSTIMNADRILVLADGQIVESGNHQMLLAKDGEYARLYNAQKF